MQARCIQECWHGPKCIKYTTDGGLNGDGIYDVDPLDPIAMYFEFPVGTVKYHKIPGNKKEGRDPVQTTIVEGGELAPKVPVTDDLGPTKKEIMAKLDELGIEYKQTMNKTELTALLPKE